MKKLTNNDNDLTKKEIAFVDILCERLIGKKIKLYKVFNHHKRYDPTGLTYYITSPSDKVYRQHKNSSTCKIVEETYGIIKSIKVKNYGYEGEDFFQMRVCDETGKDFHIIGLQSLTSKIELL